MSEEQESTMDTTYDVFLSHSSADKPAVEGLARQLIKEETQPTTGPSKCKWSRITAGWTNRGRGRQ